MGAELDPSPSRKRGASSRDASQHAEEGHLSEDRIPEILDSRVVAALFGTSLSTARRAMARGDLGSTFFVGRRRYIRRSEMLRALRALEFQLPEAPPSWAERVRHAVGEQQ